MGRYSIGVINTKVFKAYPSVEWEQYGLTYHSLLANNTLIDVGSSVIKLRYIRALDVSVQDHMLSNCSYVVTIIMKAEGLHTDTLVERN